jgi:hypothetical protein
MDDYSPYLVNRYFSLFPDTLYFAQMMNLNSNLDNKLQYDFYLNSLRPSKRFAKWPKKADDDLNLIREWFGYSYEKAKTALAILTEDQISEIRKIKGDLNE